MGRRVEQQVAGFWQGRDDHESAQCLGGCQTRCAAGSRTMLDPWLPQWTEGTFRTVPAVILDDVEFLQEQGSRQEPAGPPVAAGFGREACRSQRRLRLA